MLKLCQQVTNSTPTSYLSSNEAAKSEAANELHKYISYTEQKGKETQLKEKKIEVISTATQHTNDTKPVLIPSRFQHLIDIPYMDQHQIYQNQCHENVKAKNGDAFLRYKLAEAFLLSAEVRYFLKKSSIDPIKAEMHAKNELGFVSNAKRESKAAKNINYFDALSHYADCLIMEYEGVDCKDIERVEQYVYLLKLSHTLNPELEEIRTKLEETISFLKNRWLKLKEEAVIEPSTYDLWLNKLNQLLSDDPLKALFKKNPDLFNLATKAKYATFFKKYPYFKTLDTFLENFPNEGLIKVEGTINKDSVRQGIAKAGLFARSLALVSPTDILTPATANAIKDSMLADPRLMIYFGNKDDVKTLHMSFRGDKKLVAGKGDLIQHTLDMEGYNYPIYRIFIAPKNLYVKA